MLQSSFEDRVASKKASKLLTDDVGFPTSRAHKFLVFNRFKAFYTATLKKRCANKKYGCQYHGHNSQDVQKHIKSCKVTSEVAAVKKYSEKSVKCTSNGCAKSFPT
jgi:hypothetical protein